MVKTKNGTDEGLMMLVFAFATRDLIMEANAKAVEEKYRFYSYGDCMLIV